MNRLQERYENEVVKSLMEKFNYSSKMQAPKIEKIVLNIGVGDAVSNSKLLDDAVNELTLITGQKPVVTRAKKSIAGFKLREGQAIGCKVTLRGERMYEFLDKLVNVSLPRVRDFRGVSNNSFDGRGNYTLGVKEQLIFPEIDFDKVNKYLYESCLTIIEEGIIVNLYNFPLCNIDERLYSIAHKSISDYKVRFKEECENCKVKKNCGGFFNSTINVKEINVKPIL